MSWDDFTEALTSKATYTSWTALFIYALILILISAGVYMKFIAKKEETSDL